MEAAGLKTKVKILVKVVCIFPDVTIYNSRGYYSFRSAGMLLYFNDT
jgi:hypothetical protein